MQAPSNIGLNTGTVAGEGRSSAESNERIPVGISECLLGSEVRFNGGHKRQRWCTDVLSQWFDFRPVCPEMAVGMGVPRKPVRLLDEGFGRIEVVQVDDPANRFTDELMQFANSSLHTMADVSGFIFTAGSPSCGMGGVKVYLPNGHPVRSSHGVFAGAWMAARPELPFEDSGRLNDVGLRENFVMRVFVHHAFMQHSCEGWTAARLIDFHARHKFLVLAHSVPAYQQLGRMLSNRAAIDVDMQARTYQQLLMQALSKPATRGAHCNVLMHLQGYLKPYLQSVERQALRNQIEQYQAGFVPLIVPMTMIRHYLDKNRESVPYACNQAYLMPYPDQLGLRNAI
jgi:uncharacterized protein YbgA (DUF1722 family)/uncharacterized protein YbbK (DUF523 family)